LYADVERGNLKICLAVMWRLILRYQLQFEAEVGGFSSCHASVEP
jgi:hypothetical protein